MIRRGFTLVELLVVIAIIAVCFTIAAPAFQRDRDAPLAVATRELAKLLEAAHLRALQHSTNLSLVIDPQLRRYWIIDRAQGETVRDASLDSALARTMSARQVYEFSSKGLSTPDTTVLMLALDSARLVTEPLTGEVRVLAR